MRRVLSHMISPGEEVPDDFFDPTRSPGFDMADASSLARDVGYKLEKQAMEASEAKKDVNTGERGQDASKGQEKPSEAK